MVQCRELRLHTDRLLVQCDRLVAVSEQLLHLASEEQVERTVRE